jgi:hypothetical protein
MVLHKLRLNVVIYVGFWGRKLLTEKKQNIEMTDLYNKVIFIFQ